MKRIDIDPTEYCMSHWDAPRGRGFWIFCSRRDISDEGAVVITCMNCTYTAAKRDAREKARLLGVTDVLYTMP